LSLGEYKREADSKRGSPVQGVRKFATVVVDPLRCSIVKIEPMIERVKFDQAITFGPTPSGR